MDIAEAETRRRKRPPGDAVGAELPATRRRLATTSEDVTDDEVEEFFAILHRMREATRLLAQSAAPSGQAESVPRWRPAFEREDFEEAGSGESASRRVASEGWERSRKAAAEREDDDDDDQEETMAENGTAGRFLDLNEEPAGDE